MLNRTAGIIFCAFDRLNLVSDLRLKTSIIDEEDGQGTYAMFRWRPVSSIDISLEKLLSGLAMYRRLNTNTDSILGSNAYERFKI